VTSFIRDFILCACFTAVCIQAHASSLIIKSDQSLNESGLSVSGFRPDHLDYEVAETREIVAPNLVRYQLPDSTSSFGEINAKTIANPIRYVTSGQKDLHISIIDGTLAFPGTGPLAIINRYYISLQAALTEASGNSQCDSVECLERLYRDEKEEWNQIKKSLSGGDFSQVAGMIENEIAFGFRTLQARLLWSRFQSDLKSQTERTILEYAQEFTQTTPEWVNFLHVLVGFERSYVAGSRHANYTETLMEAVLDRLGQTLDSSVFNEAAGILVRIAIRRNPEFDYLPKFIQKYKKLSKESTLSFLIEEDYRRLISTSLFDFQLKDIHGNHVQFSEYRQKIIILDFWASYCAPCIKNMPLLNTVEEKFKDRGDVVFIKVSIDRSEAAWKTAVEKNSIHGILLIDQDQALLKRLQINSIPAIIAVGRNGVVVKRHISSQDSNLEQTIRSLL